MAVDKDLFLYDLAVVAIMKNEAPYVKEWLDYHIAAGVDHFYIYDNESPDNLREVLQPYIDAGAVTYKFYPGKGRQCEAYTEACKNYRFFCRYMAFIDTDEFIFPQTDKSVVEILDEIFNEKPTIGAVGINWRIYGSNNLETADYSKGVLERFTRRAEYNFKYNRNTKTFANPRKIKYFYLSHSANYFLGCETVNENLKVFGGGFQMPYSKPIKNTKIVLNHYIVKSKEEFLEKMKRGNAELPNAPYTMKNFENYNQNDVFDDSILKYRDERRGKKMRQIDYEKLVNALIKNLAPVLKGNATQEFFEGKMETFLTCLALATYLKKNILGNERGEIIEKASLNAIYRAGSTNLPINEAQLFLSELPDILSMNYLEVENIRKSSLEIVEKVKNIAGYSVGFTANFLYWEDFYDYNNVQKMLQYFDNKIL